MWTTYILMFVIAAAGLWVIFTIGMAVRAPDDFSGEWAVQWDQSPTKGASNTMRVQQSGRFFTVRLGDTPPISMTLDRDWRGRREGRVLRMRLRGEVWTMEVTGDIPINNATQIQLARVELSHSGTGTGKYVGIARRGKPDGNVRSAPTPMKKSPAETANAR
jgi:hypothetical protein